MPMRPRSGRAFEMRQRKSWSSSSGHDVLDRTVLAGRVHRLKNDEECVSVARPEELLCVRELLDSPCENRPGLVLELLLRQLFVAGNGGPRRVAVGEGGLHARLDHEVSEYPFLRGDRLPPTSRRAPAPVGAVP